MTAAPPLARYGAVEGALASGWTRVFVKINGETYYL